MLHRVTCAPITRTIRGIPTEVEVGPSEGLPERAVISCDNLVTIGKARLDPQAIGRLGPSTRIELDRTLRYSLDIIF